MGFKNRFKETRKELGLNQSAVAEILDTDRSTITKWETGKSKPTADMLVIIADRLNVSVDYLLGRAKQSQTITVAQKYAESMKIIDEYTKLNDLGKHEAVKRIKELSLIPSYRGNEMPIAAHSEGEINEEEMRLMREDLDEL